MHARENWYQFFLSIQNNQLLVMVSVYVVINIIRKLL